MNKDISEGKWEQMKGKIREQWADLTDDEAEQARSDREQFFGKVQEKYGETRESAQQKFDEIVSKFSS